MTNSETSCALRIQTYQDDRRRLAELIADQAGESPPLLAWAEPDPLHADLDNSAGQRVDFVPLVRGVPSWPTDLPLVEARLFWPRAALHAVAREGGGCIWMRIEEVDPDEDALRVTRSETLVHTRSDLARFGLTGHASIKGLRAIEYRERGRLVAWRMGIAED